MRLIAVLSTAGSLSPTPVKRSPRSCILVICFFTGMVRIGGGSGAASSSSATAPRFAPAPMAANFAAALSLERAATPASMFLLEAAAFDDPPKFIVRIDPVLANS